jgi:hypothetical protein
MTIGDILDGAVEIVKIAPRTVLALTAIVVLPVQLALVIATSAGVQDPTPVGLLTSPLFVGQVGSDRTNITVVLYVLSSAVLPILTGAIAWLVASWYGGSSPGLRDVGRAVAPRIPALLAAWLVVHVLEIVAGGLTVFLFVLGALAAVVLFMLTAPVIAVEGRGPFRGLRRAVRLARSQYFTLLGVALLSALVENAVFFAFTALAGVVTGFSWGWMLATALTIAGTLASKPILAGATALAYIDVRVRLEGLDLELAAAELLADRA